MEGCGVKDALSLLVLAMPNHGGFAALDHRAMGNAAACTEACTWGHDCRSEVAAPPYNTRHLPAPCGIVEMQVPPACLALELLNLAHSEV